MKKYYPIFANVEGRKCVVVGGGEVAARKAKSLAEAGAEVKAVSPDFCQRLIRLEKKGGVVLIRRRFRARDLDGAFLVIACTDDAKVNEEVYAEARARRILANVVDSAELCDFIVPSVVSRGALKMAISTFGVSPALARRVRIQLQKRYGPKHADFLELMANTRDRIIREVPRAKDRRRIFEALTAENFLDRFLTKSKGEGRRFFQERLDGLLSGCRKTNV